jgi:hypothetical protein
MPPLPTQTPNVTAAQVLAWLSWAASQAVAWHWLHGAPNQVALSSGATLLAVAWHAADSHLRHGRALVKAAAIAAGPTAAAPVTTPATVNTAPPLPP